MRFCRKNIFYNLKFVVLALLIPTLFLIPSGAYAEWKIIDSLNLAPFVPTVLDTMMSIATGGYAFFVGDGNGIIYALIWGFLALTICLYMLKMYFPEKWASLLGFSDAGNMFNGNVKAMDITMNILKPGFRAIIALTVLLQIRPTYVTEWLINPFLEFGNIYTAKIFEISNKGTPVTPHITCPESVLEQGWLTKTSCDFLVQPVDIISQKNNQIIKQGFMYLTKGLRGMLTLTTHGGQGFMNVVTGILLITTFVSCNFFMALLIIQAIFDFGWALILYPLKVLMWVAKPKNKDKWFDIWPPFSDIISSLQKIVITMIACAFILCINIAVIRAMFNSGTTEYVAVANGVSYSNLSGGGAVTTFGQHSTLWLSAILTFYLMKRIFEMTREKLREYTSGTSDNLYKKFTGDVKTYYQKAKQLPGKIKDSKEFISDTVDTFATIGRGIGKIGRKIGSWFR